MTWPEVSNTLNFLPARVLSWPGILSGTGKADIWLTGTRREFLPRGGGNKTVIIKLEEECGAKRTRRKKKETFEYFIGRIQNFSTKRLWGFEGNQTLVEAFDSFLNAVFRKCGRVWGFFLAEKSGCRYR